MRRFNKLREFIKKVIKSNQFLSTIYFSHYYNKKPLSNDKALMGKMQQLGHSIDLKLTQKKEIPHALLNEIRFILKRAKRRKLQLGATYLWAYKMYIMGKEGIPNDNSNGMEIPESAQVHLSGNQQNLIDVMLKRRSIRRWKDKKISINDIYNIIEISKWAPTSCNRQFLEILLVDDKTNKEFLTTFFPNDFYKNAPLLAIIFINASLYGSNEKHFAYLDGAAFIQNMLLLLHSRGFGACWVGFKGWNGLGEIFMEKSKYEFFYKHFALNPVLIPISLVAIGYPDHQPGAPSRQDLNKIILSR